VLLLKCSAIAECQIKDCSVIIFQEELSMLQDFQGSNCQNSTIPGPLEQQKRQQFQVQSIIAKQQNPV
jgi:hypothetical protein